MADADATLLERLRAGDEQAFASLVKMYQAAMLRFAHTLVGNPAVAEEVVQDTWLAVVRGVDRFEGRSTFKTWLFHILVNRARTARGRERRVPPLRDDPGFDFADHFAASGAWAAPPRSWTDEVDDRLVAERLAGRIKTCLTNLPAAQHQAVLLHDVESFSTPEVAALLRTSEGNVRVLLHRGRSAVRARLAAELEGLAP